MAGGVVRGQRVAPEKAERSRQLRRAMTLAEKTLWSWLRNGRLGGAHFRRQQPIDGFIVDFYCHQAAIVVEVDGPVHAHQLAYDRERDQVLAARGICILRFTNEAVLTDLRSVLTTITAHLHAGTPIPWPPHPR